MKLLGIIVAIAACCVQANVWQPVIDAIEDYNIKDMAVSVANESGIVFLYEKGNFSFSNQVMNVASTTKWVSGTMILRVVASGNLKLSDYCHQHFDFWTKDPDDPRSRIQLRHLLSFTSGYYQASYGSGVPCFRNSSMDYVECVQQVYETVPLRWEPGTVWDYHSLHLKIAGGMAVMASGKSIRQLLDETVADIAGGMAVMASGKSTRQLLDETVADLGMTKSYYDMDQNPELAGSLWTTGEDYNKFLEATYFHKFLPAELIKEMETDHTVSPNVKSSKKSWGLGLAVGHYSFANWLECDVSLPEPRFFRSECYEKSIHTSPGVFGYYPLIDRFNRYWMQIVYDGPPIIGCIDGWAARGAIKPYVDAVMGDAKMIPGRINAEPLKAQLAELLDVELLAKSFPRHPHHHQHQQ